MGSSIPFTLTPDEAVVVLIHAEQQRRAGQLPQALAGFRLAISQHPTLFPDAYLNMGNALRDAGDAAGAATAYRDAVALCPWHQGALRNLSAALSLTDPAASVAVAERTVILDPAAPFSLSALQTALQTAGDDRASRWARRLASAAPQLSVAWQAMAFNHYQAGDADRALVATQQAVALTPADAGPLAALGVLYQELRRPAEALRTHRRAQRADPPAPGPRWNEAMTLLDQGDLGRGWDAYEHRFAAGATARRAHFLDLPQWDGRPLDPGERLLVWREQGIGDEIMWASLYPELPPGTLVECSGRLHALFARSFPHLDVRPELDGPLPPLTHQIACGSLPRLFRRQLGDFPTGTGRAYLRLDNPWVPDWSRSRMDDPLGKSLGLSWRSMRTRTGGVARGYPPLTEWRELAETDRFVSLQYDNDPPDDVPVTLPNCDLRNDLDGVAALISSLDAVVTVGNNIAALAPALGVPTAILLLDGDYTMLGTGGYPWWPNATCFVRRRDEPDWSRQMQGVHEWLSRL